MTLFLGLFSAICGSPFGATVPLPSAAQPGRVQEQLKAPEAPGAADLSLPAEGGEQVAPPQAKDVTFRLESLQVEGVTVYASEELSTLYDQYIGQEVSLATLYDIANRLTAKYRNDGYILSRAVVPAQEIEDGRARIVVVEGFVDGVYIEPEKGSEALADVTRLKELAARLKEMKPLNSRELERVLLLMNDLPGVSAKGIVRASGQVRGAADLHVVVKRQRVSGYVDAHNRGSRYMGPGQISAGVTLNQVFDENDSLSLRGTTSYQARELRFGEANYRRTLTDEGLKVSLLAGSAITHPGASLEPFEVVGRNDRYAARLSYPLVKGRSHTVDVYGVAEANNVSTKALGVQLSKDRIRAARAGADWRKTDRMLGTNRANLEVSQGIDGFGSSGKGDPISRPAAKIAFTKVAGTLSREQAVRNSPVSFFGAVTGQYSPYPLQAPEEFGVGGESFGSGYDFSEITGDSGAAARVEARYAFFPGGVINATQPYVFYDAGFVNNRDPGVGIKPTQTLASAGVGVRVYVKNGWYGAVEVADPISRPVAATGNSESPRVFARLVKTF